jgi:D-amino peptidase
MISGDDVAVAEARALIGNIEGAVVKRAISFHSATTMTPTAAQALIREAARRGVTRRGELRPYVITAPVRLDLTFKHYLQAEVASYLPGVERPTAHSVRYVGRDLLVVSRLLEFLGTYQPELRP